MELLKTKGRRKPAIHSKEQQMTIFTTRSARQARRAMFDVIGAVALTGAGVILLLAYFDVLTK